MLSVEIDPQQLVLSANKQKTSALKFLNQNISQLAHEMDFDRSDALESMPDLEIAATTSLNSEVENNNGSSVFSLIENVENVWGVLLENPLIVAFLIFLLLLCLPFKKWWYLWNISQGKDPSSSLASLPVPPGEFGYPIIGETLHWLTQGSDFNASRRKKFGKIFKTNIIGLPMVRVTGHEHVKQILQGEHTIVTTIWPINIRKILGTNGMANSCPAMHKIKRKIACKAFTSAVLNGYIPQMQKIIQRNIKSFTDCNEPRVHDKMLRLTYDLAASALLGIDPQTSVGNKMADTFHILIKNVFSVPINLPGSSFNKALKARSRALELLEDHIIEKKKSILREIEEGEDCGERKSAFEVILKESILESLRISQENNNVQAGEGLIDNLTLKEIAIELMFAGYFTTASALTSCILELARNPRVVQKLEEELIEYNLLNDEGNDFSNIDLSLIHRLTYMDHVQKETLRIKPSLLGGYRRAKTTFQLGDYRIPKGWTVVYNIRDTHEFEFDGQETFYPERFETRLEADDKYKYIPFGGGARMCVGREYAALIFKLVLIEMIRSFDHWDLVNPGLPKMKAIPALHPADGLPCNFYHREKYGAPLRSS